MVLDNDGIPFVLKLASALRGKKLPQRRCHLDESRVCVVAVRYQFCDHGGNPVVELDSQLVHSEPGDSHGVLVLHREAPKARGRAMKPAEIRPSQSGGDGKRKCRTVSGMTPHRRSRLIPRPISASSSSKAGEGI